MENVIKDVLILDIETVSYYQSIDDAPDPLHKFWERKASFLRNNEEEDWREMYASRSGIYSEFGRIIVIGLGYYHQNKEDKLSLRVKAFASDDEKQLLAEFKAFIESNYNPKTLRFCTHNGKEFDLPFLCRRMIVNGIEIPETLKLSGKKPWEIKHIDIMDLWKFGDRKSFVSLGLLSFILGIPSSKEDMDGSMVSKTYYQEKDGIKKIKDYCMKDVIATGQVYLKMNLLPLIESDQIKIVDKLE